MRSRPRYDVVAVSIRGGHYEASGWLEIRERRDLRWWEARCKVLSGWHNQDLTGSATIRVLLNLAGGGQLTGTAFVDQARHLWGWKWDEADLKMHGTEHGFKLREPRSAPDRRRT